MFKFCSLYSGSSGNSLFIENNNAKILIDAGESAKKIVEALTSIQVDVKDIDAILVTHEHKDHVKGLGTLSQKYNIPVYATQETWDAMPDQSTKVSDSNKNNFIPYEDFSIKDLVISPFKIPHDAANPCGYNISFKKEKISIATDLGHITEVIFEKEINSVACFNNLSDKPNVPPIIKFILLLLFKAIFSIFNENSSDESCFPCKSNAIV